MAKKYLTAIFVTFIFVIGLAAGLILVRQSQEIRRRAQVPTDIAVSLLPASQTISKGDKATISIVFTNTSSPGRDISINAFTIDLQFDSNFFTASNLSCSNGLGLFSPPSSISVNKVSITCGSTTPQVIATGTQKSFSAFDITAIGDGESQITITGATIADATTNLQLGTTLSGGSYKIAAVGGGTPPPSSGGGTQAPQGTPNPCGGSCGSNSNCQSGLACSNGFCRNPSCPNSTNCACTPTPKPTTKPKPKGSPTATPSPTQIAVVLQTLTPTPFPTTTATPQVGPQGQTLGSLISKYWLLLGGLLLFLFAIILVVKSMGGKPPLPPIPPQQPPMQPPIPPMMPGSPPVS